MVFRLVFHVSVLAALSVLGVWLFQMDLLPAHQGGFSKLDGLAAAMYWFALLIYALFSSFAYLVLRRRSFQSLMIAYLFSAGIGMLGAVGIVVLGQTQANKLTVSNASTSTPDPRPPRASQDRASAETGGSAPTVPSVTPE